MRWVLFIALMLNLSFVSAATLKPEDFAEGVELVPGGEAAFFEILLPDFVYQNVVHPDLRDVRVFNAAGQMVNHALEIQEVITSSQSSWIQLPFFPMYEQGSKIIPGTRIRINPDGNISEQSSQSFQNDGRLNGYLIDTGSIAPDLTISDIWFDLGSANNFITQISIAESDDLAQWRVISKSATLAVLNYGAETLEQNVLSLRGVSKRYLRVFSRSSQPWLQFNNVRVRTVSKQYGDIEELSFMSEGKINTQDGSIEYDISGYFPITSLNLKIAEPNYLYQFSAQHKNNLGGKWLAGNEYQVYKLRSKDLWIENPSFALHTNHRYWQFKPKVARIDDMSSPNLEVTWRPHKLKFIARGEGPFLLAYGKYEIETNDAGQKLVRGFDSESAVLSLPVTLGNRTTLGGIAATKPSVADAYDAQKIILWSILGIGVLILGGMAIRLLRELAAKPVE